MSDSEKPEVTYLARHCPFVKRKVWAIPAQLADGRWKPLCGGSFRVRALQATGDPWAPDPACYLTDKEIA
jgi:MoaA/NifB/PqqE/SkfB family radical SAM enzyme